MIDTKANLKARILFLEEQAEEAASAIRVLSTALTNISLILNQTNNDVDTLAHLVEGTLQNLPTDNFYSRDDDESGGYLH